MATFTFVDEFRGDLGKGVHNLSTGALKWALTNTAPVAGTTAVIADITQIAAGNGYTTGGTALTSITWAETGAGTGIWRLTAADTVFTASGGSIGTFRYAVLYNDTPTSPADPVIGFLDNGSSVTVTTGNTFTIDIGASGIFTTP